MSRKYKGTGQAIIIAIIMLILGCGVLMAITKGFTDWNPYGWFNKQPAEEETATETAGFVYDGEGKTMTSNMSYTMPSAMVFSSTTAESRVANEGITINVSVYPVEASNKNLIWGVEWLSPYYGDEDDIPSHYISVNGNTSKAIVKCLAPFNYPITLYCQSVSNPEVRATCRLDYLQRFDGLDIYFSSPQDEELHETVTISRLDNKRCYNWWYEDYTTEDYTIPLQMSEKKLELKFTEEFLEFLRNRDEWKQRCEELNQDYQVLGQTGIPVADNDDEYLWDLSSKAIARDLFNDDLGYKDVENFISTAITTLGRTNLICAVFTYKNNFGEEITYINKISVNVSFTTAVESISLDTAGEIF